MLLPVELASAAGVVCRIYPCDGIVVQFPRDGGSVRTINFSPKLICRCSKSSSRAIRRMHSRFHQSGGWVRSPRANDGSRTHRAGQFGSSLLRITISIQQNVPVPEKPLRCSTIYRDLATAASRKVGYVYPRRNRDCALPPSAPFPPPPFSIHRAYSIRNAFSFIRARNYIYILIHASRTVARCLSRDVASPICLR